MKTTKRKTIAEKNADFAKLPVAKQRVEIAKDVLMQLKIKKLIAKKGDYFMLRTIKGERILQDCELQNTIRSNKIKNCNACVMGALFYSKIRKMNEYKTENSSNYRVLEIMSPEIVDNIDHIFTLKQMRLMESAFELWGYSHKLYILNISKEMADKALAFGKQYFNDDLRLKAIMRNTIKNNGTFKP